MRLLQSVHGVGDNVSHDVVRVEAGSPAYHSHAVVSVYRNGMRQGHHGTRGLERRHRPDAKGRKRSYLWPNALICCFKCFYKSVVSVKVLLALIFSRKTTGYSWCCVFNS